MVGDKFWGRGETPMGVKVQGTCRLQPHDWVSRERESFHFTVNRFTGIQLHSPDGNILVGSEAAQAGWQIY